MVNEEKAQALYSTLSQEYDLGDYDSYRSKLEDPDKRKAIYDAASESYAIGDTFDDFDSKLWQPDAPVQESKGVDVAPMSIFSGINTIRSASHYGTASFFEGLDNLAWFVGKQLNDPRAVEDLENTSGHKTKPFGAFGAVAEDQRKWGKHFESIGINPEAGRAYALSKKIFSGLGEGAMDVTFITAFGLPQYMGLMKAAESAGAGGTAKQLAASAGEGLAEGALMHGIFKGLGVFKPKVRIPASGVLFSGQQLIAESQLPEDQRDYDRVIAAAVTGMGLASIDASKGRSFKDVAKDALGSKYPKARKQAEKAVELVEADRVLQTAVADIEKAFGMEGLTTVERAAAVTEAKRPWRELNYKKFAQNKARASAISKQLNDLENLSPAYKALADVPDLEYAGQSSRGYAALKRDLAKQEALSKNAPFRGRVEKTSPVDYRDPNVLPPLEPKRSYKPMPEDVRKQLADLKLVEPVEFKKIITDLSKALGETSTAIYKTQGGGRMLTSGIPIYTPEGYKAAKPHFSKAWDAYKSAGRSFARYVEDMTQKFGDNVLPYLRQFEQENGNPVTKSTPFGDVTAPSKSNTVISRTPVMSSLPLDSYAVAQKVVENRNRKAAALRKKYGDGLTPEQAAKVKKLETRWDEMHPVRRASMKDKADRIQQGAQASEEYVRTMRQLSKGKTNDKYLLGETAESDVLIQRRNAKTGLDRPAVTSADADAIRSISGNDIPRSVTGWNFTSMIHLFNRMGDPIKRAFLYPHAEADHRKTQLVKHIHKQETTKIRELKKTGQLTKGWVRRVGAYGIANRNAEGRRILEKYKVPIPKWEDLSVGEKAMYEFYREQFRRLLPMVNKARERSGEAPIPEAADYVPFLRMINEWEASGGNPLSRPIRADFDPYRTNTVTPFPFKHEMKPNELNLKTDLRYTFNKYLNIASDHIYRSPVIAKQRELLKRLEDTRGNKVLDLREDAPNAFNEIQEYVNYMAGQRKAPLFSPEFEKSLYKLNSNIGIAVMSGNLRSTLIQPSAFGVTVHKIGLRSAMHGISALRSPAEIRAIFNKSRVLDSRYYDVFVGEMSDALTGKLGEKRDWLAQKGLAGLTGLDMLTAVATWKGAFHNAHNVRGLSEGRAIRFADDVVLETQASAARSQRSKIQRTAAGKALTLFGTFNINQFSYIRREVLGLGNKEMSNRDRASAIMRWAMITGLVNTAYDALGMRPPFPSPLRSGIEEGLEEESVVAGMRAAASELVEYVPVIGGTRYSEGLFGAAGQTVAETANLVLKGEGGTPKALQVTGKWVGAPFTQQAYKTYQVAKYNKKSGGSKRTGSPNRTKRTR